MTRSLFGGLALAFLASAALAAEVEVAPPPREAGAPLPADESAAGAADNPAETVDRIVKNAKSVGDKLAMTDTGADTRNTQGQILKDIDALLKRAENPPPQSGQDKNPPPSGGGSGGGSSKSKSGGGQKNNPSAGMKDGQPMGGRPKRDRGGDKGPAGGEPKTEPDGKAGPDAKPDPKDGPGGKDQQPGGAAGGNPNGRTVPMLPIDDEVVKDVWGHLPEKMRQQISEYYKEQFMPGYANLLRQYYSSLAEQNRRPAEQRK